MYFVASVVAIALCLSSLGAACLEGIPAGRSIEPNTPTIELLALEVAETKLRLRYAIANKSPNDIWIFTDMLTTSDKDLEVVLDDDAHSLVIRRRLSVPVGFSTLGLTDTISFRMHRTSYVRMHRGERRVESLSFELPVQGRRIMSPSQPTEDIVCVNGLRLQIGYCTQDLPLLIRNLLKQAEWQSEKNPGLAFLPVNVQQETISVRVLNMLNRFNDSLHKTPDRLVIPHEMQRLIHEDVLQIRVDGLCVPYEESDESGEFRDGSGLR